MPVLCQALWEAHRVKGEDSKYKMNLQIRLYSSIFELVQVPPDFTYFLKRKITPLKVT